MKKTLFLLAIMVMAVTSAWAEDDGTHRTSSINKTSCRVGESVTISYNCNSTVRYSDGELRFDRADLFLNGEKNNPINTCRALPGTINFTPTAPGKYDVKIMIIYSIWDDCDPFVEAGTTYNAFDTATYTVTVTK